MLDALFNFQSFCSVLDQGLIPFLGKGLGSSSLQLVGSWSLPQPQSPAVAARIAIDGVQAKEHGLVHGSHTDTQAEAGGTLSEGCGLTPLLIPQQCRAEFYLKKLIELENKNNEHK